MKRPAWSALVLILAAAGCDERVGPAPITCERAPEGADVMQVSLGTGPVGFRPLEEGAALFTQAGRDGSNLVSLRVAWRSATPLRCARVRWLVFHPRTGGTLVQEELQLESTPIVDWSASGQVFYDADDWPAEIVVEATVYGVSERRTLQVGGWEAPDAGR